MEGNDNFYNLEKKEQIPVSYYNTIVKEWLLIYQINMGVLLVLTKPNTS